MSDPFDTESSVAVKEEEKENVLLRANEEQTKAGKTLLNRLYGPKGQKGGWKRETKLNGRAGVGKTWLAQRVVEGMSQVTDLDQQIYLTAPTHRAVHELRLGFDVESYDKVQVGTLQSVMDLTVTYNKRGTKELIKDTSKAGWSPEPSFGDVLIVDESSMIGEGLYSHIQDYFDMNKPMRVLWIGDDAQLPPVQERSAKVLEKEGPTLNKIVRQANGSAIIQAASIVRDRKPGWKTRWMDKADGDELEVLTEVDAQKERVFQTFQESEDLYSARILAFRNDRVHAWNQKIKSMLYPNAPQYAEGMPVMAQEFWQGPEVKYGPTHTSQVFRVKKAQKKTKTLVEDKYDSKIIPGFEMEVWELELHSPRIRGNVWVQTPTEANEERYENEISRRLKRCKQGDIHWKNFYRMKEALLDMTHGWGSTTHSAQGCSIEKVVVDVQDLLSAPGGDSQVNPLLYVAITRASDHLIALDNH